MSTTTVSNKRGGEQLPHSPQSKKAKQDDCDLDSIQDVLQSNCKEMVNRCIELIGFEADEEDDDEEEDDEEEAQPTVNLLEEAKKCGKRLRRLKNVGDEQANRLRSDLLETLDEQDEFDEDTHTRGQCTDAQAEYFIEAWIAMDEEREEEEEEEEEE